MRLGALLTSHTAAFAPCCYLAEGFLTWLFDALAILADILDLGATSAETGELLFGNLEAMEDLAVFSSVVNTGRATDKQQQQGQQQPQPTTAASTGQPQESTGPVNCGPWNFSGTMPGGRQAQKPGAFTNKPVKVGDVAIDPRDFGYDDYYDQAHQINPNDPNVDTKRYPNSQEAFKTVSRYQQELKNALITITPTSTTPQGVPSGPWTATDAIHPPNQGGVDVYRAPTKAAARKVGRFPGTGTVTYDPSGQVRCPGEK
jgi:hypothetical protein